MKTKLQQKEKRLYSYIKTLSTAAPQLRQRLLDASGKKPIRLLSEISLNLVNKRLPVKKARVLRKLRRHRTTLKRLARGKSIEGNRAVLKQTGAGTLIPLLVAAVGDKLRSVIQSILANSDQ